MKILHFADLHIGHENYGKIDDKTGLSTRLLDFLKAFESIADYALKNKVDLVIFAGDAYKTRDPSPTHQREFGRILKKIAEKIPVAMITGNHDIPPSFGKADTLEIYPTLAVPNIHVFSKPTVKKILIANDKQPIAIVALPWILRSSILDEKERHQPIEKIREILAQKISKIYKNLLGKLDPKIPAIAIVHQSVSGAVFGADKDTYMGNDPVIPVSILADPRLSYVALGHLHKHQVLSENPPVIYSGSPERVDFGESGDKKGFVVAKIDPLKKKKTIVHFETLPARQFLTINITIPKAEQHPNQYVKNEIKKAEVKDAILKINLEGQEAQLCRILESDLRQATKEASFVAAIAKKSEKRLQKIEISKEHLGPKDWLNQYLEIKKFSQDEQKEIKHLADQLMEESGQ